MFSVSEYSNLKQIKTHLLLIDSQKKKKRNRWYKTNKEKIKWEAVVKIINNTDQLELIRSLQLGEATFRGPETWNAYGCASSSWTITVCTSCTSQLLFSIVALYLLFCFVMFGFLCHRHRVWEKRELFVVLPRFKRRCLICSGFLCQLFN